MSTLVLNHKWENLSLLEKLQAVLSLLQAWGDRHYQRKQLAKLITTIAPYLQQGQNSVQFFQKGEFFPLVIHN